MAITSSAFPIEPIAELFAKYRARDPNKTAIVDLDGNSSITFGELEQVTTDIAVDLKRRGVKTGDRVLLLSDECLEKLLIWFAVWRIGAVVCPLNIEINEKMMVELTRSVNPKTHFLPQGSRYGGAGRRSSGAAAAVWPLGRDRRSAGRVLRQGAKRPQSRAKYPSATIRKMSRAFSALRARRRGRKSWSTITAPIGSTGLSTLEFLGLTEDDRTLEYRSFGWNSAQVLSLMPFLEKGLTMHIAKRFSHSRFFEWIKNLRHYIFRRCADRAQHAAQQAARLHREGRSDACG